MAQVLHTAVQHRKHQSCREARHDTVRETVAVEPLPIVWESNREPEAGEATPKQCYLLHQLQQANIAKSFDTAFKNTHFNSFQDPLCLFKGPFTRTVAPSQDQITFALKSKPFKTTFPKKLLINTTAMLGTNNKSK